jgi:hypothetical protein
MTDSLALPTPPETVTQAELNEWYKACEDLAVLKARELELRNKIFRVRFPKPVEGTNKSPLGDGWIINAKHIINRNVLKAELVTRTPELEKAGIVVADLIENKPELKLKAYRALNDEQRKLFDAVLEIKPGTPQMEIVKPKRG